MFTNYRLNVDQQIFYGFKKGEYCNGSIVPATILHRATVVSVDDSEVMLLNEFGELIKMDKKPGTIVASGGDRVLWTKDIPQGDAKVVAAYISRFIEKESNDMVFAFHVSSVDDGLATASFVSNMEGFWLEMSDENIRDKKYLLEVAGLEANDFIMTIGVKIREDEDKGFIVGSDNAEVIAKGMTLDECRNFVKTSGDKGIIRSDSLAMQEELEEQIYLEQISKEPDRALVFVKDRIATIISHQGRLFHIWHDAADTLYDQAPGDGLWVLENTTGWSSNYDGEYDAGIDGDWMPANLENIEWVGMSIEDLDQEIFELNDRVGVSEGSAIMEMEMSAKRDFNNQM